MCVSIDTGASNRLSTLSPLIHSCVCVSVLTAATWKLVPLPLSGRWAAGRWGRWELETQTSKQKVTGSEWVSECARSPSPKTFTHRSSVPPASHSSPSSYHKQQPALSTPKDREDKFVRRSVCPKPPCFACGEQLKRGRKRRRTEVYPPLLSLWWRAQGAPGLVSGSLMVTLRGNINHCR